MSFKPKGIIPALITPLNSDLSLNESVLRELIDYVIDEGVHGIFVSGTTGEFYGLSGEEKRRLFKVSVEQARGRVPVYAGTNGITTRESVEVTKIAEQCGVDAVSVLTPMFISPTQEELYEHYRIIAESTKLPVLLYNNSTKTGVTIAVETAVRLADIENIVGIKDSSGDFTLTSEYIRNTKDKDFSVLLGRDTLIHAGLCYGATGSISACANIIPKVMADIYDKYIEGDISGSLEAQYRAAPLRISFNLGSFPTVIKEGLELINIKAGPCISPVGVMSNDEKELLKDAIKAAGVLVE